MQTVEAALFSPGCGRKNRFCSEEDIAAPSTVTTVADFGGVFCAKRGAGYEAAFSRCEVSARGS